MSDPQKPAATSPAKADVSYATEPETGATPGARFGFAVGTGLGAAYFVLQLLQMIAGNNTMTAGKSADYKAGAAMGGVFAVIFGLVVAVVCGRRAFAAGRGSEVRPIAAAIAAGIGIVGIVAGYMFLPAFRK